MPVWDILNNQSVKNIRLNNAALDKKYLIYTIFPILFQILLTLLLI